jgi:hypothetical protein
MSNPLAIAAVTATLRNLLTQGVTADPELADTTVTMQPPDKARTNGNNANQINIFLYQTTPNAAWRNMDMPRQINQGESGLQGASGLPPLALNLFYMVTAYGRDSDVQRPFSHHLLGRAMSVIHDHAVLGADEIRAALPNNDLHQQLDRVRFTLQPLSVDEIFRLWSGFQTQYRLSVAYEVSVVLIESARGARGALPVLTRGQRDGQRDRGIVAQASLIPPFASIDEVLVDDVLPSTQRGAELGAKLTINGHHLDGDRVRVLFETPALAQPVTLTPEGGGTGEKISVVLVDTPATWVAGVYSVTVTVTEKPGTKDERVRSSNAAVLALAPKITTGFPINAPLAGANATIAVDVDPEVRPDQRAILLLGDRQIVAEPHSQQSSRLTFVVKAARKGDEFLIRVRVDGVDSVVVDRSVTPPVFKPHKVVIV